MNYQTVNGQHQKSKQIIGENNMSGNIPMFRVAMNSKINHDLLSVIHSGWIGQGPKVKEFEEELSRVFNNDKVLSLSSGTHGLSLALRLCNVGPGDEVITTPLTCLSYLTSIETDKGFIPIGKIVNQKLDFKVKSLNEETGKIEWKKVINWIKLPSDDVEWYNLYLENGNPSRSKIGKRSIWITGDHRVLTNNEWKRVDELKTKDNLEWNEDEKKLDLLATDYIVPNKRQMEFINGTLLGDGHIQKNGRLTFAHCEKQKDWLEFKYNLLKEFLPNKKVEKRSKETENIVDKKINEQYFREYFHNGEVGPRTGYCFETQMSIPFKELRKKWYSSKWSGNTNNKIIPDIEITPLTLATLYMDDGSLTTHTNDYAAVLCTECFNHDYFWRLFYKILEYGIKCTAHIHGKGYRIYIGKGKYYNDGIPPIDKFLKTISPYIIPSMRYKLPIPTCIEWDEFDYSLWDLGEAEVYYTGVVAKKGTPPDYHKPKYVYCLEVEDNHNFVTKNMIVSNCTATNMPIMMQGADIIWADIKKDFNIDPKSIEESITEKTKAIIVVHWGGYPCDMDEIADIGSIYDIPIIEDCAHAYMSIYKNHLIGDCYYSDYAMFSFQAIKHLTTVDGGALCCKDKQKHEKGKLLRWYGIDRESPRTDFRCEEDIVDWGYKFHMNDVCATIGINNMNLAVDNINAAIYNGHFYDEQLSGLNGIELTQIKEDRESSYWLYTMLVDNRSEFTHMMGRKGIAVSRVHERNDKHTCFKKFRKELPELENIIDKMICIPVGWWVTEEDRDYIVDCIKAGW